jgi:hypothetical protein
MSQPLQVSDGWNQWRPAPPLPPRRSRALLAVLIVLLASIVAVVAFGVVLISQQPEPQAVTSPGASSPGDPSPTTLRPVSPPPRTPSTTTPTPSPVEPPTAEPTSAAPTPTDESSPDEPSGPEDVLVRNPLYDRRIPDSDCSQPPRPLPTSAKADERYLKAVIGCMADAYRAPLEAAGFTLTRPGLVVYRGTVETPCGQGLKGYPVFYCPANQTVYSSAGSTEEYGDGLRLAGYWIVFHEYAHHVQRRIGVLQAAYTRDEGQNQISRRIELQADCFMAMTGISVRSTGLTEEDRAEMVRWREAAADDIHGTTASQLYWINRGFGTDRFRRCSTWTATKHIR